MAKPFYSMDEVCDLLGKSADDVKGMVRDGSLREFRDAGKVFFKAEDVDVLAGKSKSDTGMVLEPIGDEAPSAKDSGASDSIALEPSRRWSSAPTFPSTRSMVRCRPRCST